MNPVWALGLMTGTVLDGNIDLALLHTDGERIHAFGPWTLAPYPPETSALIAQALETARQWQFTGPEPAIFAQAEAALTRAQSAAILAFLEAHGRTPADIDIVGFHGQTVLHRPPTQGTPGRTRQLGDGPLMAALTGIDTAYDFRTADVEAGGQGAPLAATYHAALLAALPDAATTAILNLGGVANLTWQAPGQLVAFDTGPANAPINDWVARHTGAPMDRGGALASAGHVDEPRLAQLLAHPYFAAPYPKSLDRYSFPATMADGLSLEDGAATLTAFTAATVGRALDLLPSRPTRLIVCGGGRKNPAIMAALHTRAEIHAIPAESVHWRGDAVEAELFALLAVRCRRNLPISYPGTTGVPTPMPGGRIALSKPTP